MLFPHLMPYGSVFQKIKNKNPLFIDVISAHSHFLPTLAVLFSVLFDLPTLVLKSTLVASDISY